MLCCSPRAVGSADRRVAGCSAFESGGEASEAGNIQVFWQLQGEQGQLWVDEYGSLWHRQYRPSNAGIYLHRYCDFWTVFWSVGSYARLIIWSRSPVSGVTNWCAGMAAGWPN